MNKNQTKKILMKDEKVLYTYKPYFLKETFVSLFIVLVFGAIAIITYVSAVEVFKLLILMLIIAGLILIYILFVVLQYLAFKNKFYTVTDKRFIIQKGLIGIDFSSILLEAVQFVSVNVSVLDKILKKGTGTITFGTVSTPVTTNQVPRFVFANIFEVYDNYKIIKELIDEKIIEAKQVNQNKK